MNPHFKGEPTMKFMALWRPRAVNPPTGENIAEMGKLHEDMVKKGALIENGVGIPTNRARL
jgi:hypothetical protein